MTAALKWCPRCKQSLPTTAFRKKAVTDRPSGLQPYCKPCQVEANRESRQRNFEKVRVYHKEWNALNRERMAPFKRESANRAAMAHPEQRKARSRVQQLTRQGLLVRPTACPRCGETSKRIQAHHADYSKPDEVEFMCSLCHAAEHGRIYPGDPRAKNDEWENGPKEVSK